MDIKNKTILKMYVGAGTVLTSIMGILAFSITGQGTLFHGKVSTDPLSQQRAIISTLSDFIVTKVDTPLTALNIGNNLFLRLKLESLHPMQFIKAKTEAYNAQAQDNLLGFQLQSNTSFSNVESCSLTIDNPITQQTIVVDQIKIFTTSTPKAGSLYSTSLLFNFSEENYSFTNAETALLDVKCGLKSKVENQQMNVSLTHLPAANPPITNIIYANQKSQYNVYNQDVVLKGLTLSF